MCTLYLHFHTVLTPSHFKRCIWYTWYGTILSDPHHTDEQKKCNTLLFKTLTSHHVNILAFERFHFQRQRHRILKDFVDVNSHLRLVYFCKCWHDVDVALTWRQHFDLKDSPLGSKSSLQTNSFKSVAVIHWMALTDKLAFPPNPPYLGGHLCYYICLCLN